MSITSTKEVTLVLGAAGMLGNAVFRELSSSSNGKVYGTVRALNSASKLPGHLVGQILVGVDVENTDSLMGVFAKIRPTVIVNCIGLVKQLAIGNDALSAIPTNALLPHRLAKLCHVSGARLVHFSTDCVFSGSKGLYAESDVPDANDLYGRSKYLGEVDYPHSITLRTSIIGHELDGARSLISWFLAQEGSVKGYKRAVFSGLPTVEIARIIRDFVIPHPQLHGLYHVSAEPINKFDLLTLVAKIYNKNIEILADESLILDRSLDSARFRDATGFKPKAWPDLIQSMKEFG